MKLPFGTPEFQILLVAATDSRHQHLTNAQLEAIQALVSANPKAVAR